METLLELLAEELTAVEGVARRVACNRVRRLLDELDPPRAVAKKSLDPYMTEQEAHAFGRQRVSFGMHSGKSWAEVPTEYVAWLCDQKRGEWRQLIAYLKWRE